MGWKPVLDPLGRYQAGFDRSAVYEFKQAGEERSGVFRLADQSPFFNVAGLMFREPPSTRILANKAV